MRGRWRLAAAVATAMIALYAGGEAILLLTPIPLFRTVTAGPSIDWVIDAAWVVAAVVVVVRQPASQLWKILLLQAAVAQVWLLYYLPVEPHAIIESVGFLFGELWAAVMIHLIVAYPSGRLLHRFDRRLVVASYGLAIGVKAIGLVFQPEDCWSICGFPVIAPLPAEVLDLISLTAVVLVPVFLGLALFEMTRHWRAAGPAGRRVMSPMLIAAPLWSVTALAGYLADRFMDEAAQDATHTMNILWVIQGLIIPGAIIWGAVRSGFARGRIADLAVELSRGVPVGGLRDALARALGDPSLVLAFPAPVGQGYVDSSGSALQLPENDETRMATRIDHDGTTLAVLVHDPAIAVDDPGLVEAVGSVAQLALENERLAAQVRAQLDEVRASRARIVEAGDVERRRVERDLHDGAQQRLVALAMRLDLARTTTGVSPALLDETAIELRAAVAEVRDLARGLHPPILTEAGLGPAIEALAERGTLPVTVEAPDRRFPTGIEATAYFVVSEGLTNASRYAEARTARVVVEAQDGTLSVVVRDDGRGGADAARGSGLRGLADRVAAAGGRLTVESPVGGGTTLRAELPLPA